jgi:hypothetical protein
MVFILDRGKQSKNNKRYEFNSGEIQSESLYIEAKLSREAPKDGVIVYPDGFSGATFSVIPFHAAFDL